MARLRTFSIIDPYCDMQIFKCCSTQTWTIECGNTILQSHVQLLFCYYVTAIWIASPFGLFYIADEEGEQKSVLSLLVVLFKKDKTSDSLCRIYEKTQVCLPQTV